MRELDAIIAVSNIAGFSHFAENLSPEQLIQGLNRYAELIRGLVTAAGGEVILYVGDAAICLWAGSTDPQRQAEIGATLVKMHQVAEQIVLPEKMRAKQHLAVAAGRVARTDNECGGARQTLPIFGAPMDLAKRLNSSCRVYQRNFLVGHKLPVIWPQWVKLEKLPDLAGTGGASASIVFAVNIDGEQNSRLTA